MALRDSVGLERVVVDTYQSRLGHRRRGDRRAGGPDPGARRRRTPEAASRLPAPDRVQRAARDRRLPRQRLHQGGVEGRHREPQDPRTCRTSASRAPRSAIPVFVSHSEAVHVETRDPITPDRARSCSPPCRASSSRTTRATHDYPLATEAAGRDEIFVGRVRQDRRLDPRRSRPRLLGRLRQPPQGRRDERGRARRGARRARLGPPGRARGARAYAAAGAVEATA